MIDDDVERLQAHFDKTTENLKKELARLQVINVGGTADMQHVERQLKNTESCLILRYCKEKEINKMRQ